MTDNKLTDQELDFWAEVYTQALLSMQGYAESQNEIDFVDVDYCEVCGSQPACTEIQGYEVGCEPDELRWVSYAVCAHCLRMAERGQA